MVGIYEFNDQWSLSMNGSWAFQEKNSITDPAGAFTAEPKNSNNHLVIASVDPSYQATERLKLAVNYSFLFRSANFYDPVEELFAPAKTKHTVGASATYAVSPRGTVEVRASHSWVAADIGPLLATTTVLPIEFLNLPPSLSYTVWAGAVAANVRF